MCLVAPKTRLTSINDLDCSCNIWHVQPVVKKSTHIVLQLYFVVSVYTVLKKIHSCTYQPDSSSPVLYIQQLQDLFNIFNNFFGLVLILLLQQLSRRYWQKEGGVQKLVKLSINVHACFYCDIFKLVVKRVYSNSDIHCCDFFTHCKQHIIHYSIFALRHIDIEKKGNMVF